MNVNRRDWLVAMGLAFTQPMWARTRIRLGGPVFLHSADMRELAREHRRLRYSAAYCPAGLNGGDTAAIAEAKSAFAAEDLVIAEVGAWKNMLDVDPEKRRANLQYVQERLSLAGKIGARCCIDTEAPTIRSCGMGRIHGTSVANISTPPLRTSAS